MKLVTEAWEKCWEEQKGLEEKRAQLVAVMKAVVGEAAEVAVDRERRIILQVSFSFVFGFFPGSDWVWAGELGGISDDTRTTAGTMEKKGSRGEFRIP